MNIQDWFPLGLTGWISLQSKELWRVSSTPQFKNINSLVLSFLYSSRWRDRTTQDRSQWRVLTTCGPLEKEMANQYSCLENPMNSMKRQKDRALKGELPRVSRCPILENNGEIIPERMKRWSQNKNNTQLWMWLVMEVKSDAVKYNIALEC